MNAMLSANSTLEVVAPTSSSAGIRDALAGGDKKTPTA